MNTYHKDENCTIKRESELRKLRVNYISISDLHDSRLN